MADAGAGTQQARIDEMQAETERLRAALERQAIHAQASQARAPRRPLIFPSPPGRGSCCVEMDTRKCSIDV